MDIMDIAGKQIFTGKLIVEIDLAVVATSKEEADQKMLGLARGIGQYLDEQWAIGNDAQITIFSLAPGQGPRE